MLRALVPSESPEGIIVYLHGGGWVVGDLDDFDTLGRFIATESNCIVVLPLIVAGDSAGGNLAAVCARRARDSNGPAVAQQILIYPVTQPDLDTPSYRDPSNQGLLSKADMTWFWKCYVPNLEQRDDPDVAPLLVKDLAGLPPAIVITAEHDVLNDEGALYAIRLEEAGVPVFFRQFKNQIHGFFTILNALPASKTARRFVIEHIRKAILANHCTTI